MAEENEGFIEDDAIALADAEDSIIEDADTNKIIPFVMERYHRAEDYRNQDEERWLRAYRNYRGLYGPDVQFTEAEKSRVFIKVTKTITNASERGTTNNNFSEFQANVPITTINITPTNDAIGISSIKFEV